MGKQLVIGLDLGTTTCKAVVIDAATNVVASASAAVKTLLPREGWVEQDAGELWTAASAVLREVVKKVGQREIAGLCLSGAMHSVLPMGTDDKPVAGAMTWADERGQTKIKWVRRRAGMSAGALYHRTGCPLQAEYHAARLRWWLEDGPEAGKKAARFVALRDWAGFSLTGVWATDHGLASTTGLLDIHRMAWDGEALALAGVSGERLPALVGPGGRIGEATAAAAAATGLLTGTPVFAGGSDGAMANLGAGGSRAGQVVITVGTSGAVRLTCDKPRSAAGGRAWCYVMLPDRWVAGGAINNGGVAAQWVRERFYTDLPGEKGFEVMMAEAVAVEPETPGSPGSPGTPGNSGMEGLVVLPYFAGERSPYWRPDVRGAFVGLSSRHGRAHIARATLEGVAFCLADVWDALGLTPARAGVVRLTGGIVRARVWCQIVADVLGVEIAASEAADASAVGAAMLGAVSAGLCVAESLEAGPKEGVVKYSPDRGRHLAYLESRTRFQKLAREIVFGG